MNYEEAKSYLLSRPAAIEDYPFGADVLVPKVKGKMFATLGFRNDQAQMNLKCDPEQVYALRNIFSSIIEAYHMNKQHWITVILEGDVPNGEIERLIDQSYSLVVKKLKKTDRVALDLVYGKDFLLEIN